jgi:hypothetical protein
MKARKSAKLMIDLGRCLRKLLIKDVLFKYNKKTYLITLNSLD